MLKKPNIICCGSLQLLNPCSTSSPLSRPVIRPVPQPCRTYASAHDAFDKELSWPTNPAFTPYDIFKQQRGSPYSKSRYYDLVKIYHPDRPCNDHPLCREISPEVRLYRYRLVVAAHEILSDPAKRAAYDQFGIGWSHNEVSQDASPPWHHRYGSRDYGPIWNNATWEDWEEWNNRDRPKQQQMVDNRTFTTFIILLTLLGGAVQASWLGQYNTGYEQRLKEINEDSMRFLAGRRQQMNQLGSNEAQVQNFLIRRDPSGTGLKEGEEKVYEEVLNPRKPSSLEAEKRVHQEPIITPKGSALPIKSDGEMTGSVDSM